MPDVLKYEYVNTFVVLKYAYLFVWTCKIFIIEFIVIVYKIRN